MHAGSVSLACCEGVAGIVSLALFVAPVTAMYTALISVVFIVFQIIS